MKLVMCRLVQCPEPFSWNCWYVSIWHLHFFSWSYKKITSNAPRASATR